MYKANAKPLKNQSTKENEEMLLSMQENVNRIVSNFIEF